MATFGGDQENKLPDADNVGSRYTHALVTVGDGAVIYKGWVHVRCHHRTHKQPGRVRKHRRPHTYCALFQLRKRLWSVDREAWLREKRSQVRRVG